MAINTDALPHVLDLLETRNQEAFKYVLQKLFIDKRDIEAIVAHSDHMLLAQLAFKGRVAEMDILVKDFDIPQERAHRTLLMLASEGKYEEFSLCFPLLEPLIDRVSLSLRMAHFTEQDNLRKLLKLMQKHDLLGPWEVSNPVICMLISSVRNTNKHLYLRMLYKEFGMPADFMDSVGLWHATYNSLPLTWIVYWLARGARLDSRSYVFFIHLLIDGRYEDMVSLLPRVNMNAATMARLLRANYPDVENLEKHLKRFMAYED